MHIAHKSKGLSRRHRPDPNAWELNKKEFRYYESLDKIYPNIL